MYIEQLYTGCLAQAAYYIESDGEAAIIDPLREIEPYLALAESRGAKIKYVLETHFHADFVSSHLDLAAATGAKVVYGPCKDCVLDIYTAHDGERLKLGKIEFELLHTPGHTLESSCFLLYNEEGKAHAVFTGDTLFNGDVGRPDLAVKAGHITSEQLAGMLYDSIYAKILPLADDVIVYPGHGAGSACGKNMSDETVTTIGAQKETNYALQPMTRDAFIEAVLEGQTAPPAYFFHAAKINKTGYTPIQQVMENNTRALTVGEFQEHIRRGALVLDARAPQVFAAGHVPGAINIGLDGQYAVWVGTLLEAQQELLVVADPHKEAEAILRLARVGYENVRGFLAGGMDAWRLANQTLQTVECLEPTGLGTRMLSPNTVVLDVRNPNELASGVIQGAVFTPLAELEDKLAQMDKSASYLIHCAGGYRSMMAASMMLRHGFEKVTNVVGGMGKIKTDAPDLVAHLELA